MVKVFETVRKKIECQLVLLGSLALDDPEGQKTFEAVEKYVEKCKFNKDIKVILGGSDFLVLDSSAELPNPWIRRAMTLA